jgi:exopolyphosphatase/guanosine-5'-triphosphate,3'-diphosphate pyrophosphatase
METVRRAVVDVGTNSIKLLVADVLCHEVTPVCEDSKQTRLGKDFYDSHRLRPEAIAKTAEAVAAFAATARRHEAANIRVIATSAARDAVNGKDLTDAINAACGLSVEIISGDQEADWVFRGVTSDPTLGQGPLLLLDVGGGSSEFIVGRGKQKLFARSFELGTVRLMERNRHSDPPTATEFAACRDALDSFLTSDVQPHVMPALKQAKDHVDQMPVRLVGTGGTATLLARMEASLADFDRAKIEAARLTRKGVADRLKHLWSLPLEERKKIVGLPRNRADVILTGALIFEAVMRQFDFDELQVSTRGLRFAAVMQD